VKPGRLASPRRPPHPFAQAEHPDWAGRPLCTCGQLSDRACHQMPDNPAAELDARILGEHPDREEPPF
jgi:hypothetical protein